MTSKYEKRLSEGFKKKKKRYIKLEKGKVVQTRGHSKEMHTHANKFKLYRTSRSRSLEGHQAYNMWTRGRSIPWKSLVSRAFIIKAKVAKVKF